MGVTIFYRGQLEEGKTVNELVDYVEAFADERNLKHERPFDLFDKKLFKFKIPQHIIDSPEEGYMISNKDRIRQYASEAGLSTNTSYVDLCNELNSQAFKQVGVYIWLHEEAEPLRFVFVEGDPRLTELKADSINIDRRKVSLQYISFYRDSLATKTAYEHCPQAHQDALDLLKDVGHRYFGGGIEIKEDGGEWCF